MAQSAYKEFKTDLVPLLASDNLRLLGLSQLGFSLQNQHIKISKHIES